MSYHIVDMSHQIPYSISFFHHYDMSFKKSLLFHYFHWFSTMFMYLFMMLTTCEHSLSVVFSMVYHDFLCIFHLFHLFSTSASPFLSSFFPWTFHRDSRSPCHRRRRRWKSFARCFESSKGCASEAWWWVWISWAYYYIIVVSIVG